MADLTRNVAGDRAEVVGILPANADPHDFEPRPSDAESLASADVVLQSGGDLDLWMSELMEAAGDDSAERVELIDHVRTIEGGHTHEDHAIDEHAADEAGEHVEEEHEADEHSAEEVDPHWWQDPRNAVLAVEAIRDTLVAADPAGRGEYEANASAYIRELETLDRRIAGCLDPIPEDQRKLVTSHDSLGYFANRYDVEVVGAAIPALTTQAQPSVGETTELIDLIETEHVSAVFPEAGASAQLEEQIASESDAVVGGTLYADTLGAAGTAEATYIGAMDANAEQLASGFIGRPVTC